MRACCGVQSRRGRTAIRRNDGRESAGCAVATAEWPQAKVQQDMVPWPSIAGTGSRANAAEAIVSGASARGLITPADGWQGIAPAGADPPNADAIASRMKPATNSPTERAPIFQRSDTCFF